MDNGSAETRMDFGHSILAVECSEPNGAFIRYVRPIQLSVEKLDQLYKRLSKFDTLFNDYIGNSFEGFLRVFLYQTFSGEIRPTGLIWEVDDVGIFLLTDITPGVEAKVHFTFWDGRLRGREFLTREMCAYVMKEYQLHKLIAEIPLYSRPANSFAERVGLKWEGRLREAIRYKGKWFDMNIYGLLEHEVKNGLATG